MPVAEPEEPRSRSQGLGRYSTPALVFLGFAVAAFILTGLLLLATVVWWVSNG
jgi:hypothetical protein